MNLKGKALAAVLLVGVLAVAGTGAYFFARESLADNAFTQQAALDIEVASRGKIDVLDVRFEGEQEVSWLSFWFTDGKGLTEAEGLAVNDAVVGILTDAIELRDVSLVAFKWAKDNGDGFFVYGITVCMAEDIANSSMTPRCQSDRVNIPVEQKNLRYRNEQR